MDSDDRLDGANESIEHANDIVEQINEWMDPSGELAFEEATSNPIDDLGSWSDLYADYVPDQFAGDPAVYEAFEIGFGEGMEDHSWQEIMDARDEFLGWLELWDIDLGDFWEDWRDAYEAA